MPSNYPMLRSNTLLLLLFFVETTVANPTLRQMTDDDPRFLQDLVVLNVDECNPYTNSGLESCPENSHCVRNGHSKLGGLCIDRDHLPENLEVPQVLSKRCVLCRHHEITEWKDLVDDSTTCGELETRAQAGQIPASNCWRLQQRIESEELCGCTTTATTTEEKLFDDDGFDDNNINVNVNGGDYDDDTVDTQWLISLNSSTSGRRGSTSALWMAVIYYIFF